MNSFEARPAVKAAKTTAELSLSEAKRRHAPKRQIVLTASEEIQVRVIRMAIVALVCGFGAAIVLGFGRGLIMWGAVTFFSAFATFLHYGAEDDNSMAEWIRVEPVSQKDFMLLLVAGPTTSLFGGALGLGAKASVGAFAVIAMHPVIWVLATVVFVGHLAYFGHKAYKAYAKANA